LNRVLREVKAAIEGGARDHGALLDKARDELASQGWRVDYVALRNRTTLAPPASSDRELVVLGAAWIGETRLIDNFEIAVPR
jgi:pantoate--beta-alanine ligase